MYTINDSGDHTMTRTSTKFKTVLKVREIQERKAQGELRQLQLTRVQEQETLDDIKETQQSALTDAVRSMKVKATDAQTSRAFILKLTRELKEQETKLREAESKENEKRGELVERAKSREIVEKLDQKFRAEQSKELERKEQRLIDVLAQRIRSEQQ